MGAALAASEFPAQAGEDTPSTRGAPGILIEPPRPGDVDRIPPNGSPEGERRRRESERPGCPTNDRKLELLV